jgi:hypothetical protein
VYILPTFSLNTETCYSNGLILEKWMACSALLFKIHLCFISTCWFHIELILNACDFQPVEYGLHVCLFSSPELFWSPVVRRPSFPLLVRLFVRLSVNFYIFDFFSSTTWSIVTKLGTNHPWGKGILNCSNEGDCTSQRGDKHKRVKIKIHWTFLKIFFSRTNRPISSKLGINHPWLKGILNCSNKGPGTLQRGDNLKNAKMG